MVVSAIPLGVTLSDGTPAHTYISGSADGSIDVATWNLSHLTVTSANAGNFTLDVAVTEKDAETDLSMTVDGTEAVTVAGLPVITPAATQTISVGQDTAIHGISLSESYNTTGETFTVKVSDTYGQLSATAAGDSTVTITSGTLVTITGSLSDVNTDLASLTDTNGTSVPTRSRSPRVTVLATAPLNRPSG